MYQGYSTHDEIMWPVVVDSKGQGNRQALFSFSLFVDFYFAVTKAR